MPELLPRVQWGHLPGCVPGKVRPQRTGSLLPLPPHLNPVPKGLRRLLTWGCTMGRKAGHFPQPGPADMGSCGPLVLGGPWGPGVGRKDIGGFWE